MTVGIDWAEVHHDVALMNTDGAVLARARIDTGATGFIEVLALIAEYGGTAADTPIAIETDKNLLVVALADAEFTIYSINPRAVARYRERYGQAGGKSDPRHLTHVGGLPAFRTHRPQPPALCRTQRPCSAHHPDRAQ